MKRRALLLSLLLLSFGFTFLPAEENASAAVKRVERVQAVTLVGNLLADKDILMDSEVGGLVEQVHVDTGDSVKKGDLLITLSSLMLEQMLTNMRNNYDSLVFGFSEYKPYYAAPAEKDSNELFLGVKQARTARDYAEKEFERISNLFKKEAVAESDFDAAKNGFTQAEIALQQAEAAVARQKIMIANLKRDIEILEKQEKLLKVRAPFAGKIVDVFVQEGEKISGDPGGNFIRLVDDSKVVFKAGVPEEFYSLVTKKSEAVLSVPGRKQALKLNVTRVSPVVDAAGRTFEIEIEIDNKDGALKPGLFCRADLKVNRTELAVDASFVRRDEKGDFVKRKDGTTVAVKAEVSPKAGEMFISGNGITEGTELIK